MSSPNPRGGESREEEKGGPEKRLLLPRFPLLTEPNVCGYYALAGEGGLYSGT